LAISNLQNMLWHSPSLLDIQASPIDGGPIYYESDFNNLIVEPWNAVTSMIFLGIFIYWFRKVYQGKRPMPFLKIALPLIFLAALGSTLYHAFRVHPFLLYLDWVPILMVCGLAGFYFLSQVIDSRVKSALLMLGWISLVPIGYEVLPLAIGNNLGYVIQGMAVLVPLLLYMRKLRFRYWRYIAWAFVCFALALTFRMTDHLGLLPIGTHFLWHSFSAIATHFLILYAYKSEVIFRWQRKWGSGEELA
jgi:hypothetical protein